MAEVVGVPADPLASSRLSRALVAVLRVGLAVLWVGGASWKDPPEFGALRHFTSFAVSDPVFGPWAWFVEHVVLPNFTLFGWLTLLVEASLGAFLLIGLATRLWALVGIGQTVAIMLSTLNAPNEWVWSYLLMLLTHVAVFATAAGRFAGLDGVLRPRWQRSTGRLARLLVRVS
ncbi:MAG TPA: TQO small subunit DoxD [Pilimelia sp.]|nr:TQO small subunit DoxD [Pilimelia sp.]